MQTNSICLDVLAWFDLIQRSLIITADNTSWAGGTKKIMDDSFFLQPQDQLVSPRYQELANILQREIETETYPVGTRMPTEMVLCERFGVSRFTVREAFRRLIDNGMVIRRQGSGTVVVSKNPTSMFIQKLNSVEELVQYSKNTYLEVTGTTNVELDSKLAYTLERPIGEPWHKIEGIRYLDEKSPICWTDVYVRPEYKSLAGLIGKDTTPVFIKLEKEFGVITEKITINVYAGLIEEEKAWKLGVEPNSPTVIVIRSFRDREGHIFEVSVSEHPAGRFTFSIELLRSSVNQ